MTGKITQIVTVMLLSLAMNSNTYASLVTDGLYDLVILPTPELIFEGQPTGFLDVGNPTDGLHSSFTFGGIPGAGDSRGMTDNDVSVTIADGSGRVRGTSIGGDGYAGILGVSILGGNIVVNTFSVDAVLATAGGNFVQHTNSTANMLGSVDGAGNMDLTLDGRLGTIATFATLFDKRWNYNDSQANLGDPFWAPFTTGISQSDAIGLGNGPDPITGTPVANIGDVNGDGIDDYSMILVSASNVGKDWGGFDGVPYAEVWEAQLLSSPVPVPAAVWLFGSGLLGLIGIARRR